MTDVGNAAEDEERDASHRDATSGGDDAVGKFMSKD